MAAPVEGPLRWTSKMTVGISDMMPRPRFSCISEKPGPLVAVKDFLPARDAPSRAAMELISSSIWMYTPPWRGSSLAAPSAISELGEIG